MVCPALPSSQAHQDDYMLRYVFNSIPETTLIYDICFQWSKQFVVNYLFQNSPSSVKFQHNMMIEITSVYLQ